MHSRPTSTMSDSFFTHGLAGIDLHHAERQRAQSRDIVRSPRPLVAQVRQAIATAFITAGTMLAGEDVVRPSETRLPA